MPDQEKNKKKNKISQKINLTSKLGILIKSNFTRYFCILIWRPQEILVAEALAACHYISIRKDKIFHILHKALNSTNSELQAAAHECMKKVRQLKVL